MTDANTRYLVGAAIVLIVGIMLFVPRIPQPLEYHSFADLRSIFGLPNFWNVVSNIPFAVVGLIGLARQSTVADTQLLLPYRIFCVGIIFVAIGSAYYHYAPDNFTLVWDRLPMTIAFMSLFATVLGDSVLTRQSYRLLSALLIAGPTSIAYWYVTEQMGSGDLRPYALVQFLPMLVITYILLRGTLRTLSVRWLWLTLLFYAIAKVLEHFDTNIFEITSQLQSGHSIKHVSAAAACACVLIAFQKSRSSVR